MEHIPTLIIDLATILISASLITILFKILKQPLVLGYIVAGFIASPHFLYTPSVTDTISISTWANIGVIFLLFSLGLDFSIKKLIKVGGTAIIAAGVIVIGMSSLGFLVGKFLGWNHINSLFLGGMIAMSSTSIIYKALDDLGLKTQKFAKLILGILVIEDIVAIILMVLLSTLAIKNSVEGSELIYSISKLLFFLILWFITGIFIIPSFLKKFKKYMNDETLMIVSIGLCLLMVVIATKVGFSAALGAFVMGSILAETIEAERIERITSPIKDLFAAVFFVSVGMMVDPAMIIEHIIPILIITLTVIFGQLIFSTFGIVLSGQPLKIAMQGGFSLTQIGEFAFIIASLGVSLEVTKPYMYPIVVAVSVITTFLTPYMMKLANPAYNFVDKKMPKKWKRFLERYTSGTELVNHENLWKKLLTGIIRITLVYSVICIAILVLSISLLVPFIINIIPGLWGQLLASFITILLMSPFLRAIMIKKNHSIEFNTLWNDNRFNRGYLVSLIALKFLLAISFILYTLGHIFNTSAFILIGFAIVIIAIMTYSKYLKKQSIFIERRFMRNLHYRETTNKISNIESKPQFAKHLISRDVHFSTFIIPYESQWVGKTLGELKLKNRFGIDIVSIMRGEGCKNIPGGKTIIFPTDKIQVIGTDKQLIIFADAIQKEIIKEGESCENLHQDMHLKQILIEENSYLIGKKLKESRIREEFHCLLIGIERGTTSTKRPSIDFIFQEGDLLWVVGHNNDIKELSKTENLV